MMGGEGKEAAEFGFWLKLKFGILLMEVEENGSVFTKKCLLNTVILLKMDYKSLEVGLIGGGAGTDTI